MYAFNILHSIIHIRPQLTLNQGCHQDFKLLGKYNTWAGNQTHVEVSFGSIFLLFSFESSRGPSS